MHLLLLTYFMISLNGKMYMVKFKHKIKYSPEHPMDDKCFHCD